MSFEETIVHCSAPSLCGIKPACLFSMRYDCFSAGKEQLNLWSRYFAKQKRYLIPLNKEEGRILFFVFDRNLVEKIILSESTLYLIEKGYPVSSGVDAVIAHLLYRLMYMKDFPHEVGIFLGYPLEDVIGFEQKKGSSFIFSGFWKVYSDINRAEKLMNMYKTCSDSCMEWLKTGLSVPSVTVKYQSSFGGLK